MGSWSIVRAVKICELEDGTQVAWREVKPDGSPERVPCVWVHGGSVEDSSYVLDDLAPFSDRLRVLCPDVRGHGRSQKFEAPEHYTYAAKCGDLFGWLNQLGVAHSIWGGVSMGGALSLFAACEQPQRVRAVISISGPPFAPPGTEKAYYAANRHWIESGRFEGYFDANVERRMGSAALERLRARPERYAELTAPMRNHSVASLLALLDETYSRGDWSERCEALACPVLLIGGSEDRWPTRQMTESLAARIPGAELHIVEGGPHFPNRSHREEVQGVIAKFLDSVLAPAPS